MKYYYLINGKIMSANEKMPTPNTRAFYTVCLNEWKHDLQPCEIIESELKKVKNYFSYLDYKNVPINVTDVVIDFDNVIIFKIKDLEQITLKEQPKQVEEIEAVEFLDFVLSSGWHLNPHSKENRWRTIEQINSTKPMLSDGITTKQLYEMFKNQK